MVWLVLAPQLKFNTIHQSTLEAKKLKEWLNATKFFICVGSVIIPVLLCSWFDLFVYYNYREYF